MGRGGFCESAPAEEGFSGGAGLGLGWFSVSFITGGFL